MSQVPIVVVARRKGTPNGGCGGHGDNLELDAFARAYRFVS